LISQAVSAPGVYVFSELLQLSSIKDVSSGVSSLQDTPSQKLTSHLDISSLRTINMLLNTAYSNCSLTELGMITRVRNCILSLLLRSFEANLSAMFPIAARDQYPTLTPEQETKLKQLTILSLASETRVRDFPSLPPLITTQLKPLISSLVDPPLLEAPLFPLDRIRPSPRRPLDRIDLLKHPHRTTRPTLLSTRSSIFSRSRCQTLHLFECNRRINGTRHYFDPSLSIRSSTDRFIPPLFTSRLVSQN